MYVVQHFNSEKHWTKVHSLRLVKELDGITKGSWTEEEGLRLLIVVSSPRSPSSQVSNLGSTAS